MIAQVYPIIRLPRRFTFFDYQIPQNLRIKTGDLVKIPFKGREIFGVVANMSKTTLINKLQPVTSLARNNFLTPADVKRFEIIARNIVQSPSTVLFTAFGQIRDLTNKLELVKPLKSSLIVSQQIAQEIQSIIRDSNREPVVSVVTSVEGEYTLAALLRKKYSGQMLILCPRQQSAQLMAQKLDLGNDTALLHGSTKVNSRQAIIKAWLKGEIKTLIGTRQAALLPASNLEVVLVTDATSEDYRELSRNPRIDARNAAELLANQYHANFIYSGFMPRLSTIENKIHWSKSATAKVIDLKSASEKTSSTFLSSSLVSAIQESLQNEKSVLLSFNRKGVASHLQCALCGHLPLCGVCGSVPVVRRDDLVCVVCGAEMWMPKECPACHSNKIKQRRIGNEHLQNDLKRLFPGVSVGIVDQTRQQLDAKILLVTEYYFKNHWQPFEPKRFGTVAELYLDLTLGNGDFRSSELAAYRVQRLMRFAAQQQATCLIQTYLSEIVRPMLESKRFLENELKLREKYNLPPAKTLAVINCPEKPLERIILSNDQNQYKSLREKPDSCIIEVESPHYV